MAQSGGFQGLHDEHWQEVTHNANATLGEAVVSDRNKSLGEVVQGAILLTIYMFFSPLQQVPHGRGFQVSPRNMLQQVKGRSWPVIRGTLIPSGGPALARRETPGRALSQIFSGQTLGAWAHARAHPVHALHVRLSAGRSDPTAVVTW